MALLTNPLNRLKQSHRHNIKTIQSQPLAEISGSLGDLGTLLPIMVALVLVDAISLPSTLLFTGGANILTGVLYGMPLPVQPMKAIAAIAIAQPFTMQKNAAAGLVVAGLVGLFSATGLIAWADRATPVPVVKGIQVGAGLSLCISAGSKMLSPLSWDLYSWSDGGLIVMVATALLLLNIRYPSLPCALILFTLGLLIAIFDRKTSGWTPHRPQFAHHIPLVRPSWVDFLDATTTAALGQLPLTLLNSVIAASALASDLLPCPPNPAAPTVTELGVSVSVMNLAGCWFGAMPACHGSGGLAGQYRFGARSGASVIFLGSLKFLLGLVTLWKPAAIIETLQSFPRSLLGILILAAGVELARAGENLNTTARDLRLVDPGCAWNGKSVVKLDAATRNARWSTMLITVAALLAFKNDAVGFVAGLAWHETFQRARPNVNDRAARASPPAQDEQCPTERSALLPCQRSDGSV